MTAAIAPQRQAAWTSRGPAKVPVRGVRGAIRTVGTGDAPHPAPAPLCAVDRIAAFEVVMMMRCTAPIVARRRLTSDRPGYRLAPDASGVLHEFGQARPAYRLVRLLSALNVPAHVERRFDGGRHRFEVYRVIVAPGSGDLLRNILEEAWRSGYILVCRSTGRSLPRWQQRDRRALAVAAWRAALMAAGRRRSTALALRLADPDTTSVLVNGARLMGVVTRAQTRSGYQLLSVSPNSQYEQLLAMVSGAEVLEDAV